MENPTQSIVNFNSFTEMLKALPDDAACREYLESILWNGVPACPYCTSKASYKLTTKKVFKGLYKCSECKQRYTVTIGTMFEGTHIPLRKWFIAIYIFSLHKKGISSHQLASDLGITQKSAWFMLGRIRNAFKPAEIIPMRGKVQADETFIGGKTRNMHKAKREIINAAGTGAVHANPVFGLMQDGKVTVIPVPEVDGKTLMPIVNAIVEKDSTLVTDGHGAYKNASKTYKHEIVYHSQGEYVRGSFHTNGIENFWSHLKRGIYGVYHQVSGKHLHRYCDEFAFRYNMRKETVNSKFDYSLVNSTRLTYKELISNGNG